MRDSNLLVSLPPITAPHDYTPEPRVWNGGKAILVVDPHTASTCRHVPASSFAHRQVIRLCSHHPCGVRLNQKKWPAEDKHGATRKWEAFWTFGMTKTLKTFSLTPVAFCDMTVKVCWCPVQITTNMKISWRCSMTYSRNCEGFVVFPYRMYSMYQ